MPATQLAIDPAIQSLYDNNQLAMSAINRSGVDQELAERHLREYVEQAWHVLEPANKFVPGWHIDAKCEHLQAVSEGQIKRLIINEPPRHMKSLSVAAFWPSWEWGPNNHPQKRYLFSSYADALAIRDSRKCRNLIQSPWYQRYWSDRFQLTGDQNAKQRFENDHQGYRIATTVRGVGTGEGGDVICVDDPHNVREVESLTKRVEALLWWDESMSTRGDNPDTVAFIIIMQRSHDKDLSGHVLAKETGYEHLCMPGRYEGENRIVTSLGKPDPRKEVGELLWPERYNAKAMDKLEKDLNSSYAVAGQIQQRPVPREGGGFNINDFELVKSFDRSQIVQSIRYWDKAGSLKSVPGAKFTAGVLMHKLQEEITDEDDHIIDDPEESFVIEHVEHGQWEAPEREKRIKQTAVVDGHSVVIWVEQEPGSGGKESAQATQRKNPGYTVEVDKVTGDKDTRAEPYQTQVEAHNVRLIEGPWVRNFLDEHEIWPNGTFKDQVDAAGGAMNKLTGEGKIFVA